MRASIERVLDWLASPEESSTPPALPDHHHHDHDHDHAHHNQAVAAGLENKKRAGGVMTCKACNERNASCDGQRPRCSHCLHEQLMCFYIGAGRARVSQRQ